MSFSDLSVQGIRALENSGIPLPNEISVMQSNMGGMKVLPVEFYLSLTASLIGVIGSIASLIIGDRNNAIIGIGTTFVTALSAHAIRKLSLSQEQLNNIKNYAGIIDAFEKNTSNLKAENKRLDDHLKNFSDLDFKLDESNKAIAEGTEKIKQMESASREQIESMSQERVKLELLVVSYKSQISAMESEKKSLLEIIETQKNHLADSDMELKKLEANVKDFKVEIEEQKKVVSDFASINNTLTKDLEGYKDSNKSLEDKIKTLTSRKNDLKAEVQQLKEIHEKIRKENERRDVLEKKLQIKCENLNKLIESHELVPKSTENPDKSSRIKPAKPRRKSHPFLPSSLSESLMNIGHSHHKGESSEASAESSTPSSVDSSEVSSEN